MPLYIVNESRRKLDCTIKCQTNLYSTYFKHTNISKSISKNFPKLGKISESIWNYFQMFGKNFKLIKKFFQRLERFPNIFEIFSKHLEKFPNILGFFPKIGKISKYIQIFSKQLKKVI